MWNLGGTLREEKFTPGLVKVGGSCCDTVIHCVKPTLQNVDSTVLLWHIMAWLYVKYVYSSCSTTILQNMEDGHFNLNFNSYLTFCQWFRFRHVKTEKKDHM